jgi:hypothetical protein
MGGAVLPEPGLLLSLPAQVITLCGSPRRVLHVGIIFHLTRMRFREAIWYSFVRAAAARPLLRRVVRVVA